MMREIDSKRLDVLDALLKRHIMRGKRKDFLSTDIHYSRWGVSIYLRSGVGSNIEIAASGETMRAAVDDLVEKIAIK